MLVALIVAATVTFTGTYPQDARQKIGQRIPYTPVVQLNCGGFPSETTIVQAEHRNPDRTWTGTFYPLALNYPAGTACNAALVYWNKDFTPHVVAGTSFTV